MKAAIVTAPGTPPTFGEFPEPEPTSDAHIVRVVASALSHVTRSRASGTHYSSDGNFPFVPGVDGTGVLDDGSPVYFLLPDPPFGGLAERTRVPADRCVVLPRGSDLVQAAAIGNPGMSSWAALQERARLKRGETVLVNGATGVAGRLAVRVAKFMGAAKVIATGRNAGALASLGGSAVDATVLLTGDRDQLERDFRTHFEQGIDVVLDYLWGPSAEVLLTAAAKAAPEAVPIRFVGIGSISGLEITLPSAILRSSALEMMGSGINSVPLPRMVKCVEDLFAAAAMSRFDVAVDAVPLAAVVERWSAPESDRRVVFTTGQGG